jgi:hypothetical protein
MKRIFFLDFHYTNEIRKVKNIHQTIVASQGKQKSVLQLCEG